MNEEEKQEEVKEEVKTPSKREEYLSYMRSQAGDDYGNDEELMYGDMLDYRKNNEESKAKFAEMMAGDPRLSQALSDMSNGKRGAASALVRYFGKDVLNASEGSDEWNSIEEAEKERLQEMDEIRKNKEEYDKNIDESLSLLDEFAAEKKIDADEFLEKTYDMIIEPIFKGIYSRELLETLYNALNYESDVKESFDSGVVAGRNLKIDKMRKENKGDGMPRLGASGGVSSPKPKKKSAYKSSVWDD